MWHLNLWQIRFHEKRHAPQQIQKAQWYSGIVVPLHRYTAASLHCYATIPKHVPNPNTTSSFDIKLYRFELDLNSKLQTRLNSNSKYQACDRVGFELICSSWSSIELDSNIRFGFEGLLNSNI